MNEIAKDILMHYGMPRRSGRYPWGSGENPYQHEADFMARVQKLRDDGITDEKEIIKALGMSTTEYRDRMAIANYERRAYDFQKAKSLRADGKTNQEIADILGYPGESSIRSLLNPSSEVNMLKTVNTAKMIKDQIDEKGFVDVGKGIEVELGVSKERLRQALQYLQDEGYVVKTIGVEQATNPGQQTHILVAAKPGTEYKDIYAARDANQIETLYDYTSTDGGNSFTKLADPKSIDSKRVYIRYNEDGGNDRDGTIELRRGVEDISLDGLHYAQVRIGVDGTHYMKGMALYSDDIPEGYDVVYNTNKPRGTDPNKVFKEMKKDPDNPFGALIKANGQRYYMDENGKKQLSVINRIRDEGEWEDWNKSLPTQFLAKQNVDLINKQLNLSYADKLAEFEAIDSLTNPTIRRYFLKKFGDECDSDAVDMQAASLPGVRYQVIVPIPEAKDTEIYAPNFKNGQKVALVRYPHGGTFEIPILTVNNKLKAGQDKLAGALDAVGINKKVADRLSGADFDGDTVMVIPTGGKVNISSSKQLKGLEGFDPKEAYAMVEKDGKWYNAVTGNRARVMKNTQNEMGRISNLITDMTLQGANEDELAEVVRHSMVVIDAEKHHLDYKKSELDNHIDKYKRLYQKHTDDDGYGGASTLFSRAKSPTRIPKTTGTPKINSKDSKDYDPSLPEGAYIYKYSGETYVDKNGKVVERTVERPRMSTVSDARELISSLDTQKERLYANYANQLKALANRARKLYSSSKGLKYDPNAAKIYSKEVSSLMSKLNVALKNAPRERKAQIIANSIIEAKKRDNPELKDKRHKKELKKLKNVALNDARLRVGSSSKDRKIDITDKEWEAIQSGAISDTKLLQILDHTDIDNLRDRSMPRSSSSITPTKKNKIVAMYNSGYTQAEIAESLGVSSSTINKVLKS